MVRGWGGWCQRTLSSKPLSYLQEKCPEACLGAPIAVGDIRPLGHQVRTTFAEPEMQRTSHSWGRLAFQSGSAETTRKRSTRSPAAQEMGVPWLLYLLFDEEDPLDTSTWTTQSARRLALNAWPPY